MKSYKSSCPKEQFTYLKKSASGRWMVRSNVEDVEDERVRYSELVCDHKPTYEDVASMLIRDRYSMDAEFAIQRQRDTKPEAFAEYNDFCEACKAEAKKIMQEG